MNCHLSGRYQKRFPIQAGRVYVLLLCSVSAEMGGMPTSRKPIVRQIQCIWSGRCKSDAYSSMAAAAAERVSSLSVREGISSSGQK